MLKKIIAQLIADEKASRDLSRPPEEREELNLCVVGLFDYIQKAFNLTVIQTLNLIDQYR